MSKPSCKDGLLGVSWETRILPAASNFVTIFMLAMALVACSRSPQKPNQRTPSASPSGEFVLSVVIERDPADRNLPFWRLVVSDANGNQIFKDDGKFMARFNVYWCWDDSDRIWLQNSDDGAVYYWQSKGGQWSRRLWESGSPAPPANLFQN